MESAGRWICARAAGEALVVGCDEPELPALLEQEGHAVTEVTARDAGELPFEEGGFDSILLVDFLAEWTSCERPLAEARRVLRPGGRLLLSLPCGGATSAGGGQGISLGSLLDELSGLSVKEIAGAGDRLCLFAERARRGSRAATWQRALAVVEERLAGREEAIRSLTASVAELEASRVREERSVTAARHDVERLEIALAAALHRRDLEAEKARLTGEGVTASELRLERLRREGEKMQAAAEREHAEAERKLAELRVRLEEREGELGRAQIAMGDARDELEALRTEALSRGAELEGLRTATREGERKATAAEAQVRQAEQRAAGAEQRAERAEQAEQRTEQRAGQAEQRAARAEKRAERVEQAEQRAERAEQLVDRAGQRAERAEQAKRRTEQRAERAEQRAERAQQRAEYFRDSLVAIREGRAYRLMRILWRLRRPLRRAPRDAAAVKASVAEDPEAPPPPAAAEPAPQPSSRVAISARRPRPRRHGEPLRVASILDEMSHACFAPECELLPLTLAGWAEQLDERQPDLLLVESAWEGNGGEWQHRIATYPRRDLAGLPALRALVAGCRERGIPTAFWNKEDPVHFDRFAEAASLFDHVFTTDSRCLERYQAMPGERTVAPLPFAAQPRIHNPVAAVPERSTSPCFAGAWYRDRHPDRRRSLEALLDAARPFGLVIYDRHFGHDHPAVGFPERLQPHVLGHLSYEQILDVYKSHQVFLNANSVVDSPTMCSRRVFELAACDTAILSTPATALTRLFGEGVVAEAAQEKEAMEALERLLGDPAERSRRARAARRAVFAEHTYADRLAQIAAQAGLAPLARRRRPFALPGDSPNGAGSNGAGLPWQLQVRPGVRLSEAALADLAAATTFAEADVIGAPIGDGGKGTGEHRYANDLDPSALLLRSELIVERGELPGAAEGTRKRLREWSDGGVRLYAADNDLISLGGTPAASGPR